MKTKKNKQLLPMPPGYEALSPAEKLAHLKRLIQARRTPIQPVERRGAPPRPQTQVQQQQRTEPRRRSTAPTPSDGANKPKR